jgi:hypothetical protein
MKLLCRGGADLRYVVGQTKDRPKAVSARLGVIQKWMTRGIAAYFFGSFSARMSIL